MVDDKIFILEFLDGNMESFNALILQHEGWVHGMIVQVVRHKEDTEDLCQDIFVKVYFKLKRFRFESTFKTWLYRIDEQSEEEFFDLADNSNELFSALQSVKWEKK